MFGKLFSSNKASIARKSNNNIIVQDSEINNPIFCNSGTDLIKTLGDIGRYDLGQQQAMNVFLSVASQSHPLYPVFTAKPKRELTGFQYPRNRGCFPKISKKIKGTFRIDYKKYPHMDKSKTP